MTCSACVNSIESRLLKQNGIITANVSLSLSLGQFKYNPDVTGPRDIIDAIEVCFTPYHKCFV